MSCRQRAAAAAAATAADFKPVAQRQHPRLHPAAGATGAQGEQGEQGHQGHQGHQGRQLLIEPDASKRSRVHASRPSWRPRRPLLASYTTQALVHAMVCFSSLHGLLFIASQMFARPFSASTRCVQSLRVTRRPQIERQVFRLGPQLYLTHLLTFIHFVKHISRTSGLLMCRFFFFSPVAHNAIFCVIYSIFIYVFSTGIVATLSSLERSWKCQTSSCGFAFFAFFCLVVPAGGKKCFDCKDLFLHRPEHATLLLFEERANS